MRFHFFVCKMKRTACIIYIRKLIDGLLGVSLLFDVIFKCFLWWKQLLFLSWFCIWLRLSFVSSEVIVQEYEV